MSTSTRVTLEQYEAMIARGEFEPREEHHVELLYGEIVPMIPIGPDHAHVISLLLEWSYEAPPRGAVRVRCPGPVAIPTLGSEPEPDLVWAERRSYRGQHTRPDDVLLLIEVSDSSLPKDRGVKARLYAESGIRDYWVVNIPDRCVEVRRDPERGVYRTVRTVPLGQEVSPLAFPDLSLPVARLFAD